MAELKDSLISAAEKHQAEVAELMQEHDEIVSSTRKQQLIELEAVTAKLELAREEADKLRLKNDTLEKQLEQLDESYTSERAQSERVLQDQIDELMEKLRTQEASYRSQGEGEIAAMRDSYTRLCETNDDLKKKLDEVTSTSAGQLAEAKELEEKLRAELSELRTMLESRNAEFYLVEMRKQELEEEIVAAHELSAINDRLRAELEETRKEREAESLVSPLRDRAGKGEEGSKEDCTSLEKECFKREMSSDERKGGQCLDPILSESESEGKVAERHSKLDGADVLISLQEENKSGQNEDGELHPNGSHHRIALLEEQLRVQLDEVERLSQLATSETRRADEAQNVLKEKAAELESLMREIKQKDGIIAGLEDELEKVSREEKALRTQCADYENHCRQLESRIGGLVQEQEKLHTALIEERALVESSTASLRQLQNSLAEEEKRALELQHVLEEKLTQSASLESEAELKEEQLKREISLREDQENLVTELRKEIERIHSEHKEDVAAEFSKLNSAQARIEQLVAKEAEDKKLLVDMQSKVVIAEEKLRDIEKTREQEKFEEERIREQYASALENVKQELADAHKRIRMTEASETECDRLKQELEQIRKECEENAARHQEETDATVKQLRSKAEKKIAKIKAAAEKDVSSVKAELLLEVDQLRRDVSDRDRRIDELTLEKARTEQQLIAQQQLKEELEQRRLKEKEMNESRKSIERRILELEAGNQLLEKKNIELNEYKEKSEAQAEESDRNLKELQEKVVIAVVELFLDFLFLRCFLTS
nr:mushroom body defect protein [Haemonchus contortus]